ncbi:hypothetical protein M2282_003580 [Variovorax boronicumulans]|uniref:DUF6708 domain-containing protein n=1 Tax=Variovorax boronicumulans TaxID=436515 RepID=UPI002473BF0C|nr:DUF6708 domain-containing protein [Variovorax boronicumulans]MDH6168427.1 hypothetical protein [Variovorax boronicumulans]
MNVSGQSTDEARQESLIGNLVSRYRKDVPGSHQAGHQGRLTGVYQNAIELDGGSLVSAGGYVTTFGLIAGLIAAYVFPILNKTTWAELGFGLMLFSFFSFGSVFLIGAYFELFSPSEAPIYFDRLNRRVYFVEQGKKRSPCWADWSLIDVEHHATMGGSPTSLRRIHHLVFLVRNSANDPTIMASYVISNVEFPGALWEYIRRYMDDDAPPLLAGEAPPLKGGKFDMIEALKQRKKNYWKDWREAPFTQFWQHLCIPLFIPFFFVNRLVVWTARTVHWPQEVKDALGAPITEEDLNADSTHKLRPEGDAAKEIV